MKITSHTRLRPYRNLLTKEKLEELKKTDIPSLEPLPFIKFMNWPIWLFDWMLDHQELYIKFLLLTQRTIFKFIGRLKGWEENMKFLEQFLRQYSSKQSKLEKQASQGINFLSFTNQMLADVISYYHLHSIRQAKHMMLKEWLFSCQDKLSHAKFERNITDLRSQEMKAKTKGSKIKNI